VYTTTYQFLGLNWDWIYKNGIMSLYVLVSCYDIENTLLLKYKISNILSGS